MRSEKGLVANSGIVAHHQPSARRIEPPKQPWRRVLGFLASHRVFLALSYRREYLHCGATSLSLFTEGRRQGNASHTFSADANGDGATNDLIYIPRSTSEMNFQQYRATINQVPKALSIAEQLAPGKRTLCRTSTSAHAAVRMQPLTPSSSSAVQE